MHTLRAGSLAGSVRAVAVFEAAKGALVLALGFSVLSLREEAQRFLERLLGHLHLNMASGHPAIFTEATRSVADGHLWLLAALAVLYALVRFVEAYGLWKGRPWAHWFAAVSGGIYIPFEVYAMFRAFTWLSVGALCVNVAVVGLMVAALRHGNAGPVSAAQPR
jgi:uncharacterized membrane protein (DUF2068 family)